jgi:hypothetical protein
MGNYSGATGYIGRPNNINQLVRREDISETEKDLLFYKKAVSFIVENPAAFFKLSVKKLILFWNPWVDNYTGPAYIRDKNIDYKRIIGIAFSALMLFAVIGFFNTSSVWKKTSLLLMLLLYFSIVSMVFYVSFRYRQPIIPVLSLFAGKGIVFSFSSIKNKINELSLERFIGLFDKQ